MMALKVIPGREWPLDAVTQKFAWLGRTGSGKSYACKRFVEQMLRAKAQVVIVDSVGVWFGLRQGPGGFDIPVIGGLYGDIPLEPSSGALVAEVAVSSGSSLVLDVSQMNDAERSRFTAALGQRLFELKKSQPGAMHLVLDEGQDAVPQNPLPNENQMLHEWVRICKQGRAFGMGVSIVSQRPQEISKKALNQVECVLAFQLTGAHERKALEYWLSDKGIDTKLAQTLPQLEVGVPYVWSPQWLKIAEVTKRVLPIESADTSQTPRVGDKPRERERMKPIDLQALQASMALMVERVKDHDPSLLKKRIAALEAQLKDKAPAVAALNLNPLVLAARHYAKITGEQIHEAVGLVMDVEEILRKLHQVLDAAKPDDRIALEIEYFQATSARPGEASPPPPRDEPRSQAPRVGSPEAPPRPKLAKDDLSRVPLPEGEAAILKAALEHGDRGVSARAIQIVTGYSTSYLRKCTVVLVAADLVRREGPGRISITASGKQLLAPLKLKPYPRGAKLIEHLIGILPEGESKILRLVAAAKEPLATKGIQSTTGYAASYCRKCVVSLVGRQVLSRPRVGFVQVSPEVFA